MVRLRHARLHHGVGSTPIPADNRIPSRPSAPEEASVYGALVLGARNQVNKHEFPGVVLGLSGGASALTLAIAVDALGADPTKKTRIRCRHTKCWMRTLSLIQLMRLGCTQAPRR